VPGFTIESAKYNINVHDVETDLNLPRPVVAGGTGATSADEALVNLSGEKAYQVVVDYDTVVLYPGSFRSDTSALHGPVAEHAFAGIVYTTDGPPSPASDPPANTNLTLEARDQTDVNDGKIGTLWVRQKIEGVWGPWVAGGGDGTDPSDPNDPNHKLPRGEGDDLYVNVVGDTMTGALGFDRPAGGVANQVIGYTANAQRWVMQLGDGMPETGGDVGSDFRLYRYGDGGSLLQGNLRIRRDLGYMEMSSQVSAALILDVAGGGTTTAVAAVAAATTEDVTPTVVTPTTWNPADKLKAVLSNSDLSVAGDGTSGLGGVRSTTSKSSGKLYFEILTLSGSAWLDIGILKGGVSLAPLDMQGGAGYRENSGTTWVDGTSAGLGEPSNINGIVCVAIDLGASKIWTRSIYPGNAGVWNNSTGNDPATGVGGYNIATLFPGSPAFAFVKLNGLQTGVNVVANFGASNFTQRMPSGFAAWDGNPGAYPGNGWSLTDKSPFVTISGTGSLISAAFNGTLATAVRGVTPRNTDKRYFEVKSVGAITVTTASAIGITTGAADLDAIADTGLLTAGINVRNGNIFFNGTTTIATFGTRADGDVFRFAVDFTNKRLWITYNNNNWNNSGSADPATNVGGIDISSVFGTAAAYPVAMFETLAVSQVITVDPAFAFAVPAGFVGWNEAAVTPPPVGTGNGWRSLIGTHNRKRRWQVDVGNNDAETGGNTGSNFAIARYADDDTGLGVDMLITRATGATYLPGLSTLFGDLSKPGGGMLSDISDARIKTIHGAYTKGLAEVVQLNPKTYEFKNNDVIDNTIRPHEKVLGREFVGLIAQEVESVMPEMVGRRSGTIDGMPVNDLRTMDMTPLLFALLNSVKELTARVEALETKK